MGAGEKKEGGKRNERIAVDWHHVYSKLWMILSYVFDAEMGRVWTVG